MPARATLEHLGTAAGHADRPCGTCPHVTRECGWYCPPFDAYLRHNEHGPVRCFDCCRDGDLNRKTIDERND